MSPEGWFILKVTFGSIAAVAAVLAAWFSFRDKLQADNTVRCILVKRWYADKWENIRGSGILQLPVTAIEWSLASKDIAVAKFRQAATALIGSLSMRVRYVLFYGFYLTGYWAYLGPKWALSTTVPLFLLPRAQIV